MTIHLVPLVFVLLHVSTASAWFGMGLRLASQTGMLGRLDSAGAGIVAEDISRSIRIMGIMLILTLVLGMSALISSGAVGPQFHVAALLIVIMIALHYIVLQPAGKGLVASTGQDPASMDLFRKRVGMISGIGQLIWFIILILMFWHRFSAGIDTAGA